MKSKKSQPATANTISRRGEGPHPIDIHVGARLRLRRPRSFPASTAEPESAACAEAAAAVARKDCADCRCRRASVTEDVIVTLAAAAAAGCAGGASVSGERLWRRLPFPASRSSGNLGDGRSRSPRHRLRRGTLTASRSATATTECASTPTTTSAAGVTVQLDLLPSPRVVRHLRAPEVHAPKAGAKQRSCEPSMQRPLTCRTQAAWEIAARSACKKPLPVTAATSLSSTTVARVQQGLPSRRLEQRLETRCALKRGEETGSSWLTPTSPSS